MTLFRIADMLSLDECGLVAGDNQLDAGFFGNYKGRHKHSFSISITGRGGGGLRGRPFQNFSRTTKYSRIRRGVGLEVEHIEFNYN